MRMYSRQSMDRYQKRIIENPDAARKTLFTKIFADKTLSQTEITKEAQAYIVAGSDTTAVSLTYLVWAVCRQEDIKKKLIDELNNLVEDYSDDHLRSLVYLNKVINETLRLFPAAPSALPRTVPPTGAQLAGNFIPGGAVVSTQAYSLHRMTHIFPDPER